MTVTTYNSSYDEMYPFSNTAPSVNLTQNSPLSYTVPGTAADSYRIEFHYADNSNVYIANGSTAAAPTSGTVSTASVSSYRPKARLVHGADVLSFVTPDSGGAYFGFDLLLLPT